MAEVVGLVASITAIVGIAGAAAKLSKTLYGVAKDAGSAQDDIETWAIKFASFSSVIQTAHFSLDLHFKTRAQSRACEFIKENHVLEDIMNHSKHIKVQVDKIRPYVREISSSLTFITKIKWLLRKAEVELLGPRMESVKTDLTTLLQVISLEILSEAPESKEKSKLIVQLKEQLKLQIKTIAILEKQLSYRQHEFNENSTEYLRSNNGLAHDAFVELAKSMARHGRVPEPSYDQTEISATRQATFQNPPPPVTLSGVSERHRASGSTQIKAPRELSRDLEHPAKTEMKRRTRPHHPITVMSSNNIQSPHLSQPSSSMHRAQGEGATHLHHVDEEEPGGANQANVEVPRNETLIESEYQNVRANDYLLDLDPVNTHRNTRGYILKDSLFTPTKANVDSSIRENLISQELARSLDLDIRPIDSSSEEDAINWILLKDGQKIRKVGETEFEWIKRRSSRNRPLTVSCWVYEYSQRPLVFGRPFLDTRKRRWSYASDDAESDRKSRESLISNQAQEIDPQTSKSSSRSEGNVPRLRRSPKR